jgi:pilus assembly protein CpaB
LKRSNRLILLIGLFLAAIAFVGIIVVLGGGGGGGNTTTGPDRTMTTYTVAAKDIPLGTTVTADMVATKDVKIDEKPADAYTLAPSAFSATTVSADIGRLLDTGKRAMSVQVDQVSGVGTLIKPGDRVDVVVGLAGADKFPVVTIDPVTKQPVPVAGISNTSVKTIIQNLQVVGTLLPPPTTTTTTTDQNPEATPAPALNGQAQIVVLAVSDQQAEILRFAQIDGSITLVLRSPDDKDAPNDITTGMTLSQLVDNWSVIPPQIVPIVLPKK